MPDEMAYRVWPLHEGSKNFELWETRKDKWTGWTLVWDKNGNHVFSKDEIKKLLKERGCKLHRGLYVRTWNT